MKFLKPEDQVDARHLKSIDDMTSEDWEIILNQHNTYHWLAYIVYPILWLPSFIAWVIIEYRKH
jgi:hypothetical protein